MERAHMVHIIQHLHSNTHCYRSGQSVRGKGRAAAVWTLHQCGQSWKSGVRFKMMRHELVGSRYINH